MLLSLFSLSLTFSFCRECQWHHLLPAPFSHCFITPGAPGCRSCRCVAMETETHFWSRWVFWRFLFWQLSVFRPSSAPVGFHWVIWAVTSSGVVVMNLPPTPLPAPPSLCSRVCLRVCTLVTVFLYSGIEQSLSVHSGEAENIYENPEDIRQVMNSTKYLLMIFALIFPASPSPLWYLLPSPSPPPLPSSLYSALFLLSSASVFLRLQVSLSLCHLMFIKPVFSPSQQAPPQGPVYMVSYYALTHMQAQCMHVSVQVTVTHIFTSAYKVSFSLLHPP